MFKPIYPYGDPIGTLPVDPTAVFNSGAVMQRNATTGLMALSDGSAPLGFAGENKTTAYTGKEVDEAATLNGTTAANLSKSNLTADRVKVTNEAGDTEYVEDTDYTIADTNGTITRIALGAITDGQTVLVSYEYQKSSSELLNAQPLGTDDTAGSGNVTIYNAPGIYASDQYDITRTFQLNQLLYANTGQMTNTNSGLSAGAPVIGRVFKVPVGGVDTPSEPNPDMLYVEFNLQL